MQNTHLPLPPSPKAPSALMRVQLGRWLVDAAKEAGLDPEEYAVRAVRSAETARRIEVLLSSGFESAYEGMA